MTKGLTDILKKNKNQKQHDNDTRNANPLHQLAKTDELKRMLAQSDLNSQGFFNSDVRRETSSTLQ